MKSNKKSRKKTIEKQERLFLLFLGTFWFCFVTCSFYVLCLNTERQLLTSTYLRICEVPGRQNQSAVNAFNMYAPTHYHALSGTA